MKQSLIFRCLNVERRKCGFGYLTFRVIDVRIIDVLLCMYIYICICTVCWSAVCCSRRENHNSRMNYNKCSLVQFINSVQNSGCWRSEVTEQCVTLCDVRESGDNRQCCSISEEPQGVCAGSSYFEVMLWRCVGLSGSEINLLKTKRNLLYIRNQSVPRSKHFPPRLWKPISKSRIKQKSLSVLISVQNTERKKSVM